MTRVVVLLITGYVRKELRARNRRGGAVMDRR
jgi:hypothetical protein